MLIARTRDALRQAMDAVRARHTVVALVPTMGALHPGHLSLVAHARGMGAGVAVSIFVNPLQFGPAEDLARYPRDEAGDLAMLAAAGCDAVWLPTGAEMYPAGDATLVDVGGPAQGWEGDARPGHFRGVATVVAKLFGQCRPDAACFGEKDWQQLQVIRRMVTDLSLPVSIVGVPTLREHDGLAMSSRNRFLTDDERAAAPLVHRTLRAARAALHAGDDPAASLGQARARLQRAGFAVDYLALIDGATMLRTASAVTGARLIVAARLGAVRLLDNIDAG
jgi:pantoate--beta-alanine ligase